MRIINVIKAGIVTAFGLCMVASGYRGAETEYNLDADFSLDEILVCVDDTCNYTQWKSMKEINIPVEDVKVISSLGENDYGVSDIIKVSVAADNKKQICRAVEQFKDLDGVVSAELNYIYDTADDADSQNVSSPADWGQEAIQLYDAWDIFTGSKDTVVGVIDLAADLTHQDLQNNIWDNPNEIMDGVDNDSNGYVDDEHGWDFVKHTPVSDIEMSDSIHGTHVAGIIAGTNGMDGVVPNGSVASLACCEEETGRFTTESVIEAINYAIDNNITILNASYGTTARTDIGSADTKIIAAQLLAYQKYSEWGGLIAIAAGNEKTQLAASLVTPCCFPIDTNIVVASVQYNHGNGLKLSDSSNYGSNYVEIAAPGNQIYSCIPYASNHRYMSGTSMATPFVAGAAALLRGYNPDLTTLDIIDILKKSAVKYDNLEGKVESGVLNVYTALKNAGTIYEPNQTPEETTYNIDMGSGETIQALLNKEDDVDCYNFSLLDTQEVSIQLSDIPKDVVVDSTWNQEDCDYVFEIDQKKEDGSYHCLV